MWLKAKFLVAFRIVALVLVAEFQKVVFVIRKLRLTSLQIRGNEVNPRTILRLNSGKKSVVSSNTNRRRSQALVNASIVRIIWIV